VRETAQGGFDAPDDDGRVGVELLQNARVDGGSSVGTHPTSPIGSVGVVGSATLGGSVVVDHGVHATGRDAKKEIGTP